MLSHENIVANVLQGHSAERDAMNWRDDSMISFLPMFHIYGESSDHGVMVFLVKVAKPSAQASQL